MSKKMLKRSLALGALMAFVITGQAWAAELTINYENGTYVATGTGISGSVTADKDGLHSSLENVGWADKYLQKDAITNKNSYTDNTSNVITITGGEYNQIIGDKSTEGNSSGNNVTITNAYVESKIYVATTTTKNSNGCANNNELVISNTTVNGTAASGGYSGITAASVNADGDAEGNSVRISGSTIKQAVWGASVLNGDSINNLVVIDNSTVDGWITAGHSDYGNAHKNVLEINGEETKTGQVHGGRAQGNGSANENSVTINAGTVNGLVWGGAAVDTTGTHNTKTNVEANENSVTVNGGTISGTVYGGYTLIGKANENTVTITGGKVEGSVIGSWANVSASKNVVKVIGSNEKVTIGGKVIGGSAHNTDVAAGYAGENKVYVENAIVSENIVGGEVSNDRDIDGDANRNEVTVVSSVVNYYINGGANSTDGNANENKVTLTDVELNSWVTAGHSSWGNANDNTLVINGSETVINGLVFGGRAQANGSANKNSVTITDATINSSVYGGRAIDTYYNDWSVADPGQANDNEVLLDNAVIKGNVYGGSIERSSNNYKNTANRNTVTVIDGSIDGEIYGAYAKFGEANNNTVNISGDANLTEASLYGSNKEDSIGNTLNIGEGWTGSAVSVQNFNTVNFAKGSSVTTNVTLGTGATINLANGDDYTGENYAINGKLTTLENDNATLTIGNIKANTYNIASKYAGTKNWVLENDLMQVQKDENGSEIGWKFDGQLQVTVEAKSASDIADNLGVSDSTGSLVAGIVSNASSAEKGSAGEAAADFINNVMNNAPDKGAAINAATKMGEAGGNSATAASIVKNVTGVTNDRLSFNCGHSAPHKGGHGVGLFEEGSGADIWVEYVHGKDEVEDMPSTAGKTSYEGQYNGIVMGVDFKKVNKFQSGIAFNYGEGDTNSLGSSVRTHSDYDFWGVGYYGNIHNDDSNVIFDINYAQTDSDVTQYNSGSTLEASPETTTWSAGVKLEKLYQNENVQIVPYTGLRYMSIDADDYSTKKGEFYYSMDRQDIWLLPLGVSIRQEVANDNGWTVSPRVDLSYIWAFGDTNSNMEVKSPFPGVSQIGYDVMDDGSFLGLVGIEAHKGQWGYGVAYSYQKGDHSESKKWYVDVNYSF